MHRLSRLPRSFFDRPATLVAPELLGCVLRRTSAEGTVAVRLTEVEAYLGEADPASHAFRGKTARNAVMYGEPGHVYVYFTYGMHFCMNLVCLPAGTAEAVLLRAGEVVEGVEVAAARRGGVRERDLARGPARLTMALGVDRALDGADACAAGSPIEVIGPGDVDAERVCRGPRTGVSGAGAMMPMRWYLEGEPTVSPYRAHSPRVRVVRGVR